ncbi:MAG TPA: hypothetical protein VNA20_04295 [Frankiaceae bacterium]|nr:hypothetical protein [Frankiaceae bacterium]
MRTLSLEPTPEPVPTTQAPPVENAASGGTSTTSLAVGGLVLVVLLGAGGVVGLYLTRETEAM